MELMKKAYRAKPVWVATALARKRCYNPVRAEVRGNFSKDNPRSENKPSPAILVRRSKGGILQEHATTEKNILLCGGHMWRHPAQSLWKNDDAFLTVQVGHFDGIPCSQATILR